MQDKYKPQAKYRKENMKQIKLELNKKTDIDLIELLDNEPNKAGLIKKLLREYLEKK